MVLKEELVAQMDAIFEEIRKEREYQAGKWSPEFDRKNTLNDWVTYICRYASEAAFQDHLEDSRVKLLKAAALCVASLQYYDASGFAPRHYDK